MPRFISRLLNGISIRKTESSVKDEVRIKRLEKIIGSKIKDPNIFLEALTHRSTAHNKIFRHKFRSNERLEFLGDSVLNMIIGEYILGKFKKEEEGFMTKIRSRFVNREILALTGERLKIEEILFMSDNARNALRGGAKSMISDALESIIGAIYLDHGLENPKIKTTKAACSNLLKHKNFQSQIIKSFQRKDLTIRRLLQFT